MARDGGHDGKIGDNIVMKSDIRDEMDGKPQRGSEKKRE
jgi:hypothetical protein